MLHNQNSANFAQILLIIPTFVPSVLPQNGTKNKRGTREYAQADYQGIELFEDIRLKAKYCSYRLKCNALDYQGCEDRAS